MTRKLKVLGLVLAAVLVMAAVAATSASGQTGKITSDGPVTLVGTQTTTGNELANSLTAYGDAVVCPGSTLKGHKSDTTPHGLIASGSTTATITPHYTNCKVNSNGLTAHIEMNGCDYEYTIGSTTDVLFRGGTYGLTAHIDCPTPTTHITVIVIFFGVACTTTIPEQTVTGAHLSRTAGALDIEGAFTGLKSSRSGFACATESENSGVLHVDVAIAGRNAEGGTTSISISD